MKEEILSMNLYDYTNITCNKCGGLNFTQLKSKVKSSYLYCGDCGHNKDFSIKHHTFDNILHSIKNNLESLSFEELHNLKIELFKESHNIMLFINNTKIKDIEYNFTISEKESYLLKNTIFDLVYDYSDSYKIELHLNLN